MTSSLFLDRINPTFQNTLPLRYLSNMFSQEKEKFSLCHLNQLKRAALSREIQTVNWSWCGCTNVGVGIDFLYIKKISISSDRFDEIKDSFIISKNLSRYRRDYICYIKCAAPNVELDQIFIKHLISVKESSTAIAAAW